VARFAVNRAGSLLFTVRNEDGEPVAPTAAPTVTIRDYDGTTVSTGTSTTYGGQNDHAYQFALASAIRGALGVYEATWAYTVSGVSSSFVETLEVVKAHLFEVDEIRDTYPELQSSARYPAKAIRRARDAATERLETAAGVAFTTRRTVQTLSGDGTTTLLLPHVMVSSVYAVTIYGDDEGTDLVDDALDAGELADVEIRGASGVLKRTRDVWPVGEGNIVVEYEHGYDDVPEPVSRAAMRLAVESLVPAAMPTRALSSSTDLGEVRYSVANPEAGRPTGDPEVDAVIQIYGRRRPAVG